MFPVLLVAQDQKIRFEPHLAFFFQKIDFPVNQFKHEYQPGPGLNLRIPFYQVDNLGFAFVTGYKYLPLKEIKLNIIISQDGDSFDYYTRNGSLVIIPILFDGRIAAQSGRIRPYAGVSAGFHRISMSMKNRQYNTNTYELSTSVDGSDASYIKTFAGYGGIAYHFNDRLNIFTMINADYYMWEHEEFSYTIKRHSGGSWIGYDQNHPTYEVDQNEVNVYFTFGIGYRF